MWMSHSMLSSTKFLDNFLVELVPSMPFVPKLIGLRVTCIIEIDPFAIEFRVAVHWPSHFAFKYIFRAWHFFTTSTMKPVSSQVSLNWGNRKRWIFLKPRIGGNFERIWSSLFYSHLKATQALDSPPSCVPPGRSYLPFCPSLFIMIK